ncbi:glycerophosphodiester phosphodiesterase [Leptospira andrefontaineae]|uniref:Glycerophosphodiester phosphodiesterase n=1 Tax=Leptospira andrefontaineae TaxID=2484976 RepID=A0A4R9GW07_9LEPT|nr:glycerophosphodiester phosphodiesterase [Leptospira andrefontaineae]TGK35646.1 glycerophosphodiester phosphodiesterase [Leptospira andrefontaineae]
MKSFHIKQTFLIFFLIYLSCSGEQIRNTPIEGNLDLQGHRGARGLKPENTWPAFEEALSQGMTTIELDTVLTKDQKIIIHHDSESNPALCTKKDGSEIVSKSIYELTLVELKELDCGTKKNPKFPEQISVPGTELLTIQEFFEKVQTWERTGKRKVVPKFNIETKFPNDAESQVSSEISEAHVNLLIKAIETAKVTDRATIQSFYLPAISLVKKKNPKIKTSALFSLTYSQGAAMKFGFGDSRRELVLNQTKELKADIISPYFLYVTDEFVSKAHSLGIKVIPWTVNDTQEMERLIKTGVDGIITDYPDRLNSVLKKH